MIGDQQRDYIDRLLSDRCEKHDGNLIDCFCKDHAELCCKECVSSNHSSCNGRVTLTEAVQEKIHEKFSRKTLHELDKLKISIEKHTITKSADRQRLDTEYEHSQKRVTEYRRHLDEELERLQRQFEKELQYRYDSDVNLIESDIKASEDMTAELSGILRKLHSGEDNNLSSFIGAARAKNVIKKFDEKLNNLSSDAWKKSLVYKIDPLIEQAVKARKSLGTFEQVKENELNPVHAPELTTKSSCNKTEEVKVYVNKKCGIKVACGGGNEETLQEMNCDEKLTRINEGVEHGMKSLSPLKGVIKEKEYKATKDQATGKEDNFGHMIYDHAGIIEGMALNENGQLILADSFNKSLKISHIKEPKAVQTIQLKDFPRDICTINEKTLCISYKESHAVHIVTLHDKKVETLHAVHIGKVCLGVFFNKGKLYVACGQGSKSEIQLYLIDESLSHVRFCCKFPKGKRLFVSPCCVKTSIHSDKIYVGDYHEGITALQRDGTQIWTNKGDKILKGVWGMSVDDNGDIYATGHSTNNVVKISADGITYGVVVDRLERPTAICYDSMTRTLLIVYDTNQLLLYKIVNDRK